MVKAKKKARMTIVVVFKIQETWKKGEEFGDMISRLREKYSKKTGANHPLIIVT